MIPIGKAMVDQNDLLRPEVVHVGPYGYTNCTVATPAFLHPCRHANVFQSI